MGSNPDRTRTPAASTRALRSRGSSASREGSSKAALVRRWVAEKIAPLPGPEEDVVAGLIGSVDCEPATVDDVVYGT